MGQNLYDYHDFQINQGVCRIMNNTVCIIECTDYGLTKAPLLFAAQIQIPVPNKYLGCGYKGLFFCKNNVKLTAVLKWRLIVLAKNIPNGPKYISPICQPKP